ncbi:hypothetical protein, conserved [Eimeria brunetti]|uniref:Uncharacterized protein n=1 Tax=Eimeria brunetti TaxID=51314 RepID=U6LX91_9EIME|nr:hypothetical protein, conserved [Eimeria brunetti]
MEPSGGTSLPSQGPNAGVTESTPPVGAEASVAAPPRADGALAPKKSKAKLVGLPLLVLAAGALLALSPKLLARDQRPVEPPTEPVTETILPPDEEPEKGLEPPTTVPPPPPAEELSIQEEIQPAKVLPRLPRVLPPLGDQKVLLGQRETDTGPETPEEPSSPVRPRLPTLRPDDERIEPLPRSRFPTGFGVTATPEEEEESGEPPIPAVRKTLASPQTPQPEPGELPPVRIAFDEPKQPSSGEEQPAASEQPADEEELEEEDDLGNDENADETEEPTSAGTEHEAEQPPEPPVTPPEPPVTPPEPPTPPPPPEMPPVVPQTPTAVPEMPPVLPETAPVEPDDEDEGEEFDLDESELEQAVAGAGLDNVTTTGRQSGDEDEQKVSVDEGAAQGPITLTPDEEKPPSRPQSPTPPERISVTEEGEREAGEGEDTIERPASPEAQPEKFPSPPQLPVPPETISVTEEGKQGFDQQTAERPALPERFPPPPQLPVAPETISVAEEGEQAVTEGEDTAARPPTQEPERPPSPPPPPVVPETISAKEGEREVGGGEDVAQTPVSPSPVPESLQTPDEAALKPEPEGADDEPAPTETVTAGPEKAAADTPGDADTPARDEATEPTERTPGEASETGGGASGDGAGEMPEEEQPEEESSDEFGDEPPEDFGPPREPSSPEEALQMHLVQQLTSPRFADTGAVPHDELKELLELTKGSPTDEVEVGGTTVLRYQLQQLLPGEQMEISVLEHYCNRLQAHVTARAKKGLQPPVAIISPKTIVKAWGDFLEYRKKPMLLSGPVRLCKAADRVLVLLPTPEAAKGEPGFPAGHIILAVVDRKNGIIRIIDSMRHSPEHYQPAIEFVKLLASRFTDRTAGELKVSPNLPELGFPYEVEDPTKAARLPAKLREASGGLALESLACIAENRQPNHRHRDVAQIRLRVLAETLTGLRPRLLVDGEMRQVEEEEQP